MHYLITMLFHASAAACALLPPVPPRTPVRVVYGREPGKLKGTCDEALLDPPRVITDNHFDLRDRSSAATLAHIAAENEYAEQVLLSTEGWSDAQASIERHLMQLRSGPSAPLWHRRGGWEYAKLAREGCPHPLYLRRRPSADQSEAEILLDSNAAPALLPSAFSPGVTYMGTVRGVSAFVPSPSGRFAAYTVDTTGEERFSLMIVQLPTPPPKLGDAAIAPEAHPCTVVGSVPEVVCPCDCPTHTLTTASSRALCHCAACSLLPRAG